MMGPTRLRLRGGGGSGGGGGNPFYAEDAAAAVETATDAEDAECELSELDLGGLKCTTVEYPLSDTAIHHNMECSDSDADADADADFFHEDESCMYLELSDPHAVDALPQELDANTPVYVHVFPTVNNQFPVDSITIQYWLLYPFTGPVQDKTPHGAHEGGWEHVSVVVHNATHELLGVYMAAREHNAYWLGPHEVMVSQSTHVHAFPAMFTHSTYESTRVCTAVDYCSPHGTAWMPHTWVNMGERDFPARAAAPWLGYNGYWGSRRGRHHQRHSGGAGAPPLGPLHQIDYWTLY